MFTVSQSKINRWRECKRKYHYSFVENLASKKRPRPFLRGGLIHNMIEANIEGEDPWKIYKQEVKKQGKIFKEEEKYHGLPEEIKLLMEGYFSYYGKDDLKYIKYGGQSSEWLFEVRLTDDIIFKGRLDTVARTKDGRVWLVEHKTHAQLPTDEFKFTDLQSMMYSWVLPKIGFPKPDGVCWDYIRAKSPVKPDLLQSGELSQRANMDTTWKVYADTIKEHGLKRKDYLEMKEKLNGKEDSFYRRIYLPISPVVQKTVRRELITTARDIFRKAGKDKTRTMGRHCGWCEFKALCEAELTGSDGDYIRKQNFQESDYNGKTDSKVFKEVKTSKRLSKRKKTNKTRKRVST